MGESPRTGYVVATSDDESVRDLPLDLNKYPEICRVLETGSTLVIRDASRHPLLEVVRQSDSRGHLLAMAMACYALSADQHRLEAFRVRA